MAVHLFLLLGLLCQLGGTLGIRMADEGLLSLDEDEGASGIEEAFQQQGSHLDAHSEKAAKTEGHRGDAFKVADAVAEEHRGDALKVTDAVARGDALKVADAVAQEHRGEASKEADAVAEKHRGDAFKVAGAFAEEQRGDALKVADAGAEEHRGDGELKVADAGKITSPAETPSRSSATFSSREGLALIDKRARYSTTSSLWVSHVFNTAGSSLLSGGALVRERARHAFFHAYAKSRESPAFYLMLVVGVVLGAVLGAFLVLFALGLVGLAPRQLPGDDRAVRVLSLRPPDPEGRRATNVIFHEDHSFTRGLMGSVTDRTSRASPLLRNG